MTDLFKLCLSPKAARRHIAFVSKKMHFVTIYMHAFLQSQQNLTQFLVFYLLKHAVKHLKDEFATSAE